MKRMDEADQILFLAENQKAQVADSATLYRDNPAYRQLVDNQRELEEAIYG